MKLLIILLLLFCWMVAVVVYADEEADTNPWREDNITATAKELNKLGFIVVTKEQWDDMNESFNYWVRTGERERYLIEKSKAKMKLSTTDGNLFREWKVKDSSFQYNKGER